jgi:hypothetical protein
MTKICGHCLKSFQTTNFNKIYCCKRCRDNSNRMKLRHRNKEYRLEENRKRNLRHIESRKRWKTEGRCDRCGHINDRLDFGGYYCTNCLEQRRK